MNADHCSGFSGGPGHGRFGQGRGAAGRVVAVLGALVVGFPLATVLGALPGDSAIARVNHPDVIPPFLITSHCVSIQPSRSNIAKTNHHDQRRRGDQPPVG